LAGSTIYATGGRDLYAINASTGEIIWQFDMQGFSQGSPAVADGVVFAGNGAGDFFAVDAESGEALWRFQAQDGVVNAPAVADGVVYVASLDQNVYALDAETGDELWSFQAGDQFAASPIISDGVVYAANFDTYLYGLDAETGDERMRLQVGLTLASPVMVDGIIYTASADGVVQARRPFDLFGVGGVNIATPVPVATDAPETEETYSITLGPGHVFDPDEITIPADVDVTLVIENQDTVPHTFVIDELLVDQAVEPGEFAILTLNVMAGTYTYYCELPGHLEGGMVGTLIVE
jgi:plastocyanin